MAQQNETRQFTGGLDANTAPFAIEQDAYINAENLRTLITQHGQTSGLANAVEGNVEINNINSLTPTLPFGLNGTKLIGKCVDETTGYFYLFLYNGYSTNVILRYNPAGGGSGARLLDDTRMYTGTTLGFSRDSFVSAAVINGLLVWTDNINDIRYLNLSHNYMSGSSLIRPSDISLIVEPPVVPLAVSRVTTHGITSTIQTTSLQFAYRFINQEGFTSVLSPDSLTSFAARESEIASDTDSGNSITVAIPFTQQIPQFWKYIEIVVRFPEKAEFYVIKRWSAAVAADALEVTHHRTAFARLTVTAWAGALMDQLDSNYTSKGFDLVPIRAAALERAANRLSLGNIVEGYDTPTTLPSISIVNHDFNASAPASTNYPVYLLAFQKNNTFTWYFSAIVAIGGIYYLLPKECSIGTFEHGNMQTPSGPYTESYRLGARTLALPQQISKSQLIELKSTVVDIGLGNICVGYPPPLYGSIDDYPFGNFTTGVSRSDVMGARKKLVLEANGLTELDTAISGTALQGWMFALSTISVMDDAPEFGSGSQSRAFLGLGRYQIGYDLYDDALRKCGNVQLATIDMPAYDLLSQSFRGSIDVTVPATAVPGYATNFAITLSRCQRSKQFIQFSPGLLRAVAKDKDGNIVMLDFVEYYTILPGYTRLGVGIPVSVLAQYGYGYTYAAGDFIEWAADLSGTQNTGSAPVVDMIGGMIIFQLPLTSSLWPAITAVTQYLTVTIPGPFGPGFNPTAIMGVLRQPRFVITLHIGAQTDHNQYEVAAFGKIVGGLTDTFYASGTNTVTFLGDAHTRSRASDSGSETCLSIMPNEAIHTLTWITDAGRISPTDTIGQKALTNAIRYSNVHIPGASINGIASFDALDIKYVDESAGPITALVLTTKDAQDGGQMLVICERGTFTGLVDQQQLSDAKGDTGLTVSANVFGDFNAIMGGYGCTSPRSITRYQHHVWWVDTFNRKIVEFNNAGAGDISAFKASRLFRQILDRLAGTYQEAYISAGYNPLTNELLVSLPAQSPSNKAALNTVPTLQDPFDAYVNQPVTFAYNFDANKWQYAYQCGNEYLTVGTSVFGWDPVAVKMMQEFVGPAGNINGVDKPSMIAIPFNAERETVKSLLSLRLVADRQPDATWIMVQDGTTQRVSGVQGWQRRNGAWYTAIRRDRTTGGASDATAWSAAGIDGRRLKGRTPFVVMIWNAGGAAINASSISLDWTPAAGN